MLFLGEAPLGRVAAVCDATKREFDRKCIERSRIVVAHPFFEMGMARMRRFGDRFEQFIEPWDAAAIVGRSVSFAPDVARIGHARLAGADIGYGEAVRRMARLSFVTPCVLGRERSRSCARAMTRK